MKPEIFNLLFHDDRMFVLEICTVKSNSLMANTPSKYEWAVITRRNVPGYPPHRSDTFPTEADAIDFYKQTVVTTPRVSLGKKSPNQTPSISEYTDWLICERLYDPLLNPNISIRKNP